MTHTSTPWKAILNDSGKTNKELVEIRIPGELGRVVCFVPFENKSDAAFIVRCVNSHEELLTVAMEAECLLTNYLGAGKFPPGSDCDEIKKQLREAIAKAEGRE